MAFRVVQSFFFPDSRLVLSISIFCVQLPCCRCLHLVLVNDPFKAWFAGVSLTTAVVSTFLVAWRFRLFWFWFSLASYWRPLLHSRSIPSPALWCWFACSFGSVDSFVPLPSKWTRAFPSVWSPHKQFEHPPCSHLVTFSL